MFDTLFHLIINKYRRIPTQIGENIPVLSFELQLIYISMVERKNYLYFLLQDMQEVQTDEEFQAMQHQNKIIEPELKCDAQQKITRMCINPKCEKSSLLCNDLDCNNCGKKAHLTCDCSYLHTTTYLLSERANRQKDFVDRVYQIENEFIQAIHRSRKKLTKRYYLGDLQQKYLKIVDQIYSKKNTKCLVGKQAKQFRQRLQKENSNAQQNATILLQSYKRSITKMVDELIDLKQRIYESFVKVSELKPGEVFTIDSNIIKKPIVTNIEDMKFYQSLMIRHSKTLIDQLVQEQTQFFRRSLNNPKQLQLLYRGSENNFTAATFHQKCDNIPNTLTIVRNEFGKTFAGFTQYTWNSANNAYFSQNGKNTFLLSLDLKEKMVPKDGSNLIYCNTGHGPTFGNGHDLHVADQCDKNSNSNANFPYQYNKEGQSKYTNNQDTFKLFCGAKSGRSFRVIQYQVFRVIY